MKRFIRNNPGCLAVGIVNHLREKGHIVDGNRCIKVGADLILFENVSEEFANAYDVLPPIIIPLSDPKNLKFSFM